MLRSMYAGISGMKGFQTKLDVVGNNIANVNTSGFKKGRVTFQDMLSQTMSGAEGATNNRGGSNPVQVGLGSQIGSIDNIHEQGFLQTTGRPLDFSIEGNGMFIVQDGETPFYTRAGNFYLNEDGDMVNSDGLYLQGYPVTSTSGRYIQNDYLQLEVDENGKPIGGEYDGEEIEVEESGDDNNRFTIKQGDKNIAEIILPAKKYNLVLNNNTVEGKLEKTESGDYQITFDETSEYSDLVLNANEDGTITGVKDPTDTYEFNEATGSIRVIDGDKARVIGTVQPSASKEPYELSYFIDGEPSNPIKVEPKNENSTSASVNLGNINIPLDARSFNVDTDGFVNYVDANGNPHVAGQIALANFTNPEGLEKTGDNLFLESANSGNPNIGIPNTGGAGSMISGTLEMSNVDLAEEFTEMITAQRGFQANTRIITTSDEILQELVNLKR